MSHPKKTLEALGANALRAFSQNFLTSPHWADKLTQPVLTADVKAIWEIGPGLGALTEKLIANSKVPLRVYEIDRKLAANLRDVFPNLDLVEGDFLKTGPTQLPPEVVPLGLVSNLPYHISSAILFHLVEWGTDLKVAVLTFQREFAERLKAKVGDDSYAGLSVSAQYHFKMESLGILPKGAFYPEPSIDSEALVLTPKPVDKETGARFRQLVRLAFTRPRRKLGGNLREGFQTVFLEKAYEISGIDPNRRPETLSLAEFEKLFAALPVKA